MYLLNMSFPIAGIVQQMCILVKENSYVEDAQEHKHKFGIVFGLAGLNH